MITYNHSYQALTQQYYNEITLKKKTTNITKIPDFGVILTESKRPQTNMYLNFILK